MNWEAISAIGQLVGAIAVVISLIYLASAVRSNTRATREASMRWVSDNYNRWIQQISGHPELSELYYRGIHDFESLEGPELVRFSALMVEAFRRSEEMYYLKLEGHLEPLCGMGLKRACASLADILEFRHGGVFARIGSLKSLRSTLISYRKQPSLPGCIAKQWKMNDRPIAPPNRSMHVYEVRPRKGLTPNDIPPVHAVSRKDIGCAPLKPQR